MFILLCNLLLHLGYNLFEFPHLRIKFIICVLILKLFDFQLLLLKLKDQSILLQRLFLNHTLQSVLSRLQLTLKLLFAGLNGGNTVEQTLLFGKKLVLEVLTDLLVALQFCHELRVLLLNLPDLLIAVVLLLDYLAALARLFFFVLDTDLLYYLLTAL